MANADFDEKKGDGLKKAKSVATDVAGKKPDHHKQDDPKTVNKASTDAPPKKDEASSFVDAKKKN